MSLADLAAARRAAAAKLKARDEDTKTAFHRWYDDDTEQNWAAYEQAREKSSAAFNAAADLGAI